MAYFQPMASCLADGFFPSRLICKIKIFFDVFFHIFSYFFVGVGRAEHTQENTNACGHSGNTSACIEISFYRFALLARSRILKVATCFQTGKFLSRFLVWQNCGKNKQQKNDVSAPAVRKIYERILKGQRYICNIHSSLHTKNISKKSTKKHHSEVERCLKSDQHEKSTRLRFLEIFSK